MFWKSGLCRLSSWSCLLSFLKTYQWPGNRLAKCGILFVGNVVKKRTHFQLNSIKHLIFFLNAPGLSRNMKECRSLTSCVGLWRQHWLHFPGYEILVRSAATQYSLFFILLSPPWAYLSPLISRNFQLLFVLFSFVLFCLIRAGCLSYLLMSVCFWLNDSLCV